MAGVGNGCQQVLEMDGRSGVGGGWQVRCRRWMAAGVGDGWQVRCRRWLTGLIQIFRGRGFRSGSWGLVVAFSITRWAGVRHVCLILGWFPNSCTLASFARFSVQFWTLRLPMCEFFAVPTMLFFFFVRSLLFFSVVGFVVFLSHCVYICNLWTGPIT